MNVAIIGCGLIGTRRAAVARQLGDQVVVVVDVDTARAQQVAQENNCAWTNDWHQVVGRADLDVVVVSTVNKFLMPITVAALERGKHVLVEKPMARNLAEARAAYGVWQMADGAIGNRQSAIGYQRPLLAVGFNHRYHPAIWKAHELCNQGAIGPLMFIRAVYGHGGRPGYDKEWRADADLAGGGELLDQGVHIVDLCRWFLGEFAEVVGFTSTYFWDSGYVMEDSASRIENRGSSIENLNSQSSILNPALVQLEDNAFALLRTADGRVAQFHTSWTQWKNRFTFEVFGCDGYLIVDGLGGSYGQEHLRWGKRRPESGPPVEEDHEFLGPDCSWEAEWREFKAAIEEGRQPLANGEDGLQAMRLIDAICESTRTGEVVRLESGQLQNG